MIGRESGANGTSNKYQWSCKARRYYHDTADEYVWLNRSFLSDGTNGPVTEDVQMLPASNISITPAAAAALTGIALVASGTTGGAVTLTSNHPASEAWGYYRYWHSLLANFASVNSWTYDGTTLSIGGWTLVGLEFLTAGKITAGTATAGGAFTASVTGDVLQATPTALTNVAITGNLTYTTNTPTTVTLTSPSPIVIGTISNTGTALVTVRLAGGATVGTVGANVVTQLVTALTITGLTAGSSIYVANGSGTQVDFVASSGTSYTLDTTGGTGTWTYKIARYGYTAQTGTHTPATASTTVAAALVADAFITQPTAATVAAYTVLSNPDRVYDYAAYYETTAGGIATARVAAKAGGFCSVGAYPVTLATTGAPWALSGGTLTLNAGSAFAPGVTMGSGLLSTAAITAGDTTAFTGILSDSTGIRAPLTIAPTVSLLGAQVHIFDLDSALTGALGTELAGTTSCTAASFTYYGPAGNTVWLQILADDYLEYGATLITPSAAATTSPALEQDYNQ